MGSPFFISLYMIMSMSHEINENIKKELEQFFEQCRWTKIIYDEYFDLYERGNERLTLYEEIAGNFFIDLNRILIDYILLNICKITDPAKSFGKDNLTIEYILSKIDPEITKELKLEELSNKIHEFTKQILPARNKLIVHTDKESAISNEALGGFSEEDRIAFWENLQKFVNRLSKYYFDGPCPLDAARLHGAEELVFALKKAVHFDDMFIDKAVDKSKELRSMRYDDA